jgi:hypothetical protein
VPASHWRDKIDDMMFPKMLMMGSLYSAATTMLRTLDEQVLCKDANSSFLQVNSDVSELLRTKSVAARNIS